MTKQNIRKYFTDIRALQIMAMIFGCINNLTMIGSSFFIKLIIDELIRGQYDAVKRYGLYFLVIIFFSTIFGFLFQFTFGQIKYTQSYQLRVGFFRNFIFKKMTDILKVNKGDLTTAITSDTEKVSNYYGTSVVLVGLLGLQFIITMICIIYYNLYVAIFALATVLIGVLLGNKVSKKLESTLQSFNMNQGENKAKFCKR